MRILAISQRVDFIKDRSEFRDSLDQSIYRFFGKCGFSLLPLPNITNIKLSEKLNQFKISGIILSGGNDIGQYPARDKLELDLIQYSVKNSLPLLGICRGMQMLAKFYGSELIKIDGHVNVKHKIIGEINTEVNKFS